MPLTNAQNLSRADAVMIEVIEKTVAMLPEMKTPVLDRVKGAAKKVTVNQKGRVKPFTRDVRIQLKGGSPDMNYPIASDWSRGRWRVSPVTQAVTYAIDAATYEDYTRGDMNTFVSLREETKTLAMGFAQTQEVFVGGDGSGALATVKVQANLGQAVVSLDDVPDGTYAKAFGVAYLRRGVTYEVRSSAGAFIENVTIGLNDTDINYSTNQVTLTANLVNNLTVGSKFYYKESFGNARHGLRYMLGGNQAGGYYQGFNVTSVMETRTPRFNAQQRQISNAAIENILQKHAMRQGSGINQTFKMVAPPALISIYKTPTWGMRRLGAQDATVQMGVKETRYEDSIFIPAPKLDADTLYGLDFADLYWLAHTEVGPFVVDGIMWHQSVGDGYGAGTRYMQYGCVDNMAIDEPHRHFIMDSFDVTGGVTPANFYQ